MSVVVCKGSTGSKLINEVKTVAVPGNTVAAAAELGGPGLGWGGRVSVVAGLPHSTAALPAAPGQAGPAAPEYISVKVVHSKMQ